MATSPIAGREWKRLARHLRQRRHMPREALSRPRPRQQAWIRLDGQALVHHAGAYGRR